MDEYDSGRGDFGRGDFGRDEFGRSMKLDEYLIGRDDLGRFVFYIMYTNKCFKSVYILIIKFSINKYRNNIYRN